MFVKIIFIVATWCGILAGIYYVVQLLHIQATPSPEQPHRQFQTVAPPPRKAKSAPIVNGQPFKKSALRSSLTDPAILQPQLEGRSHSSNPATEQKPESFVSAPFSEVHNGNEFISKEVHEAQPGSLVDLLIDSAGTSAQDERGTDPPPLQRISSQSNTSPTYFESAMSQSYAMDHISGESYHEDAEYSEHVQCPAAYFSQRLADLKSGEASIETRDDTDEESVEYTTDELLIITERWLKFDQMFLLSILELANIERSIGRSGEQDVKQKRLLSKARQAAIQLHFQRSKLSDPVLSLFTELDDVFGDKSSSIGSFEELVSIGSRSSSSVPHTTDDDSSSQLNDDSSECGLFLKSRSPEERRHFLLQVFIGAGNAFNQNHIPVQHPQQDQVPSKKNRFWTRKSEKNRESVRFMGSDGHLVNHILSNVMYHLAKKAFQGHRTEFLVDANFE